MENKKLIRFVESFVLLPIMTISLPFGNVPKSDVSLVSDFQTAVSSKENTETPSLLAFNQVKEEEVDTLKSKADAVDAYFKEHDMPLAGTGMKMVQEAEKNGLDWPLLASIAVIESTGGKFDCKKVDNNPFGWGSCRSGFGFESIDEAIETVARNLGGNNPKSAHHYSGKNTKEILQTYNPPSIVKTYAEQVISVMNEMKKIEEGSKI